MNSLSLEIQGLGHVPSFKNGKMIARGKLITMPARQKWMDRAIQSIEFQLRSAIQINTGEIQTEQQLRSLIASSVPLDDSRQWIAEIHVKWIDVAKGKEGAFITIEPV